MTKTNRLSKAALALLFILLSSSFMRAQRRVSVSSSLPSGTPIFVRINEPLSSETAHAGDTFTGSLAQPVVVNGRTQIAQGAAVSGRVISAEKSGRLSDPGVLELKLVSLGSTSISTQPFLIKGASHTKGNVAKIGGSTAAGTVIGAIVGGGKGAAIGAGVGAGAGTAGAAATGKKPATVEAEAVLEFAIGDSPVLRSAEPAYTDREPVNREPYDRNNDPRYEGSRHRGHDDADQGEDEDNDRDRDSRNRRWNSQGRDSQNNDSRGYDSQRYDSQRYDSQAYDSQSNDQYRFSQRDQVVLRRCLDRYDFESLPPGIQKKVARGGTLPPGQAKKLRRLPESCTARLGPLPRDVDRIIYGNRIVLVGGGGRILDIFIF
jgi:hypothetical protein